MLELANSRSTSRSWPTVSLQSRTFKIRSGNNSEPYHQHRGIYPVPLAHETARGIRFDSFAAGYDSRTSECPVRTAVRTGLVEIVRSLRPRGIADVGCGTGTALIALSPSIEFGIGLDVSHEMLTVAERNAAEAGAENLKVAAGGWLRCADISGPSARGNRCGRAAPA